MPNSYTWKSKAFITDADAYEIVKTQNRVTQFLTEQNLSMNDFLITETLVSDVPSTELGLVITVWYKEEKMSDSAVNEKIAKIAEQMDTELVGGKQIL